MAVLMLNLLIAMLGNTFANINTNAEKQWRLEFNFEGVQLNVNV
jgi:hypothetical protein